MREREPHLLTASSNSERWHNVIYFDTETRQVDCYDGWQEHHLVLGWACFVRRVGDGWTNGKWFEFGHSKTFWDWVDTVCPPGSKTYIVAHNCGYDARVVRFAAGLSDLGFIHQTSVLERGMFISRWRDGSRTIVLTDSGNFFRQSLEAIGADIGQSKGEHDRVKHNRKLLTQYCKNDVTILRKAIERWFDFLTVNNLGGHKLTLASQAFGSWRYAYWQHDLQIDCHGPANALSRASYFGGICECYKLGEFDGPIYYFDVNQMYPYVMSREHYPVRLRSYGHSMSVATLYKHARTRAIVARVTVTMKRPYLVAANCARTVLPVGRFETYITTADLSAIRKYGRIEHIHEYAIYDCADIYSRFCAGLGKLRKEYQATDDQFYASLAKYLRNSNYGKTGQLDRTWLPVHTVSEPGFSELEPEIIVTHDETGKRHREFVRYRQIGTQVEKLVDRGESYNSFPAIAAHVTGYARQLLRHYQAIAGFDNLYYSDTDSIICNAEGANRLQKYVGPNDGQFKTKPPSKYLHVRGAKNYTLDDVRTIKGVSKNGVEVSPGVFEQTEWQGVAGSLRDDYSSLPKTKTITKTISLEYKKGNVSQNGLVIPYSFPADRALAS